MHFIKEYKLTLLAFAGIMIAILMPGSDVPSVGIPNIDKAVHFCMFAVITGCYNFEYHKKHNSLPALVKASLPFIIFGLLTEIMQLFVPGRSCDMSDLVADAAGVLTAACIFAKAGWFHK